MRITCFCISDRGHVTVQAGIAVLHRDDTGSIPIRSCEFVTEKIGTGEDFLRPIVTTCYSFYHRRYIFSPVRTKCQVT
jgi:hypothetical protein